MFLKEFFCGDSGRGVEAECIGKQPLEHQEGDWSIVIILVTGRSYVVM